MTSEVAHIVRSPTGGYVLGTIGHSPRESRELFTRDSIRDWGAYSRRGYIVERVEVTSVDVAALIVERDDLRVRVSELESIRDRMCEILTEVR